MWGTGHLTQIEPDKVRDKEGLPPSTNKKCMEEQAKEHDHDFKQCHVDILSFIEAEDKAFWIKKKLA